MSRTMPDGWAVPAVDRFNEQFFTSGRIVLQECTACGNLQHPPEEICHLCLGMEFTGREVDGSGTVVSFVVVHHPVAPALATVVPYAVVLVELDAQPGARIVGNVLNRPPEEIAIGQRVRAVFDRIEQGEGEPVILLPQWEAID